MKKLLPILCFMMAALLLVSCGDVPEAPASTTSEAEQTQEQTQPSTSTEIVSAAQCFRLIRSEYATPSEVDAAVSVKKALDAKYGKLYTGSITTDFEKSNRENLTIEVPGLEILVGETNRKESRETIEALGDNEYTVRLLGDKLVICGKDNYCTTEAVNYFINTVISGAAAEALVLDNGYTFTGVRAETRPPLADGALLRYFSWNLGCMVGVAQDCLTVMDNYMGDIIGVQECNDSVHSNVLNMFLRNHREYKMAVNKHIGGSTLLYTPVIYNTKKMTLVEVGTEWLDSRYTKTNTKSICWCVFDCTAGRFAVINFHGAVVSDSYDGYQNMSSDQRNQIANTWRIDNVRQILDITARLKEKYGEIAIIVNGDCNFNSNSQPYKNIVAAGYADSVVTAKKKTNADYKTSYSYSNGIPGTGLPIDHFFGNSLISFCGYTTVRDREVGTASDHCPIYTDFTLIAK